MKKVHVVIAGAGPVGTVACYYLAMAGIDAIAFETEPTCAPDLRASTFHPSTLDMLDQLDVAETLIEQGLKAPVYQYRDRATDEVFEFDLSELDDVTKFPYRLQCEQYKLSGLLAKHIEEHPHGSVEFERRVTAFDQDADGVTVYVESPYGIEPYRADFLIAADGANSIVRKWLNIEFEGFTYPEKFLCWSTEWELADHFENLSYVNYVADPDQWCVLLRCPSAWRVLVSAPDEAPNDFLLSDEVKNETFDRLIGNGRMVDTMHRTIYRVHQRVAKRYYDNRVALVGDSAHLNNPIGGLGMNSGIHDAWNLCEKIVDVLKNGADHHALFGRFDRQRRSVTKKFVQEQTMRNKKAMENQDPTARRAYNENLRAILDDADRKRAYLLNQALYSSLQDAAATD